MVDLAELNKFFLLLENIDILIEMETKYLTTAVLKNLEVWNCHFHQIFTDYSRAIFFYIIACRYLCFLYKISNHLLTYSVFKFRYLLTLRLNLAF